MSQISRRLFGALLGSGAAGAALGNTPQQLPSAKYIQAGKVSQPWPEGATIPNFPKMERKAALALARLDPNWLAMVYEDAWLMQHQQAHIDIDPDIMIKKSWSPMYKLVAQRQRNVERHVEMVISGKDQEPIWGFKAGDFIHKLMWG